MPKPIARPELSPRTQLRCLRVSCDDARPVAFRVVRMDYAGRRDAIVEVTTFACGHSRLRPVGRVRAPEEFYAIADRLGLNENVGRMEVSA